MLFKLHGECILEVNMETRETIASELRGARAKRRLSQHEVAMSIGKTRDAVGRWEMGENGISFEDAILLADLYGISLDELAGRKTA